MLSSQSGPVPSASNPHGFGIGAALLSGLAVLSMIGCNSRESTSSDNTPPDHIINLPKSQGKYRFGVTDTLVVDFSEKIDTSALAVAFSPVEGIGARFKDQARLVIFGTASSSGTAHFPVNSPFTATLSGLKDPAGNGRTAIVESFQPYAWTDRDFQDASFTGYDSLFATDSTWIDGSSFSDSLVTEGRLDFSSNFGKEDRQDYKIVKMIPPDTLRVLLTCSKGLNIKIQMAGPFSPVGLDAVLKDYVFSQAFLTDSTKAKGSASLGFNADYSKHDDLLGSPAAPGIYVIRLSIPADTEGFYRLGLRLVKRKK
ncbi:MAG: hypothetical protein JWP91_4432 [Fibrobacteres bacterium]|nr:hypothetical protein [Fibrobacterota bacterium]